jgi:hypothetical protein
LASRCLFFLLETTLILTDAFLYLLLLDLWLSRPLLYLLLYLWFARAFLYLLLLDLL